MLLSVIGLTIALLSIMACLVPVCPPWMESFALLRARFLGCPNMITSVLPSVISCTGSPSNLGLLTGLQPSPGVLLLEAHRLTSVSSSSLHLLYQVGLACVLPPKETSWFLGLALP